MKDQHTNENIVENAVDHLLSQDKEYNEFRNKYIFNNQSGGSYNQYTESAKQITNDKSVPLNDVYKFIENYPEYPKLYMHPKAENNCHFNDTGRKVLGEQIAKFVLNEI